MNENFSFQIIDISPKEIERRKSFLKFLTASKEKKIKITYLDKKETKLIMLDCYYDADSDFAFTEYLVKVLDKNEFLEIDIFENIPDLWELV